MKHLLTLYRTHKRLFKSIAAFAGLEILMILIPLTIYASGLYLVITAYLNHPNDPLVNPYAEKVIVSGIIIRKLLKLPRKSIRRVKTKLSS